MELVEINPTNTFLSGEQLIKHRHLEIEAPCGGLKRTQNEGSAAELEEITTALANLRAQLSVPRIERLGGRALATWDEEQQAAAILRKDGKFESFGYSVQGKQYLEYYEALFLLELGRLQLEYHGVNVSVEQAYVLLLGELESEKFSNYLVYSTMSRAGYIVVRHKRHQPTTEAVTRADCIWALLEERTGNIPVASHIRASPLYAIVEKRMEDIKQLIVWPNIKENENCGEPIDFKFDTRKRKANTVSNGDPGCKKACLSTAKSLVELPKTEATFARFKSVFNKFDIDII
ncbi:tRNA-splicing endonuclease subunit Sen54 isoform X2 [Drosophila obscura]|uniref:tRNA-splicing endonuclease subunit Sen54 isoform X2 n=1 Tax=Drosophila obscura TaxID=7282 RepID=UPI001BB28052|nr:tRNA-splicing endonuclease subunit Sen54 isoform X2 [Drosophila obscura]